MILKVFYFILNWFGMVLDCFSMILNLFLHHFECGFPCDVECGLLYDNECGKVYDYECGHSYDSECEAETPNFRPIFSYAPLFWIWFAAFLCTPEFSRCPVFSGRHPRAFHMSRYVWITCFSGIPRYPPEFNKRVVVRQDYKIAILGSKRHSEIDQQKIQG